MIKLSDFLLKIKDRTKKASKNLTARMLMGERLVSNCLENKKV